MKRLYLTAFSLLVLIPLLSMQPDMTANQVIDNMIESYKQQMQAVDDITIKTKAGVTYQMVDMEADPPVYLMRSEQKVNGMKIISVYDGEYYWTKNVSTGNVRKEKSDTGPLSFYRNLKEMTAEYGGTQQVDGHKCHVIMLDDADLDKLSRSTNTSVMPGQKQDEMRADARLFVDAENWVLRKMVMDITNYEMQDKEREARMVVENTNFREVDGVMVAWKTISTVTIEMSEEEKARAEKMKKQMENMPQEQREMAEQHMGSNMEMATDMMDGEMKMLREVVEVKVNSGLEEHLFDGKTL